MSPTYKEKIKSDHIGAVIYAELTVNEALAIHLMQRGQPIPKPVPLTALIDTGATYCAIAPGLAQQLSLRPHAEISIIGIGDVKPTACHAYYVGFNLFGQEAFDVYATEFEINFGSGINALIGRDLLNRLKLFTYDGKNNEFILDI